MKCPVHAISGRLKHRSISSRVTARAGAAHRARFECGAGRVGLPDAASAKAVNVECGDYWTTIPKSQRVIGDREHSWHIGDPVFTRDMIDTMNGIDREVMVTREMIETNRFQLIHA